MFSVYLTVDFPSIIINDMVETSSSSDGVCSHDDNDDDFSSFDTFMSHLIG